MEVFKRTVSAMFGQERRYVIPVFQRPYVWNEKDQWEPLWEDVVERANAEFMATRGEQACHFLGAVVIQQRDSWGDELLAHDVIDGQQRLTTLQILLTAFRDVATAAGDNTVAAGLLGWIRNPNAIASPEIEQFKVWPTKRDVEQFRLVATAGSREAVEKVHPLTYRRKRPLPRPRMVEAYLYFHGRIGEWLMEEGADRAAERAKVLRRVFDRRLQLVSIELSNTEDPQTIFETLNARGVPLLASDLLRNYVFQRAQGENEADKLYKQYWARFEVPDNPAVPDGIRFWEVEERQGRLCRARLDLFVHHYLAMKRGKDIAGGRLFPEYKEWIEQEKRPFSSLEEELKDFTRYAGLFVSLVRPDTSDSVGRFASRLRALDTSTVYPLVLGLLGNSELPATELEGIFTRLESFIVRRLICGRTNKNYNRLFLQLLRDFEAGGQWTCAAFTTFLTALKGEAVDWPTDSEFASCWTTIDAYTALKPGRVEILLRSVEEAMTSAGSEQVRIESRLTVEHILPQEWHTHWPLPAAVEQEAAMEQREEVIHDFGNLTLLTQPLNSAASNAAASQKLPLIAQQSKLALNTYFQNRTTWSEEDIRERGRKLFEMAKKVWPGP